MRNSSLQEKATTSILQAAYESSSWEEFGAQALPSLDELFNTSISFIFRTDERGPVIASAGAVDVHLQWAERYFQNDPMVPAIQRLNQEVLQASHCQPEYNAFLKAPVYHELAKPTGVHDYLILRIADTKPYQPGAVQLLLARGHRQPTFGRAERLKAMSLVPPLKAMARWIDRSENLRHSYSTLEGILDSEEQRPKVAFDIDGKVLCASREAEKLIGIQAQGCCRIPEDLLAAVRRFGDLVKRRICEAPPPYVSLFGNKNQPIQVTLRLANTRSGKRFVLAEIQRTDLSSQFPQLSETTQRYGLTGAETQVLRLMAQGLSDNDIAKRLFVSRETIHTHAVHLFGKLGVRSRLQAALVAYGLPLGNQEN